MDVYLDNAATSSPKPREVVDAVLRAMGDENANPGRSGHSRAIAAGRRILAAREEVAALLGVEDAMSVAFQFNCTDALNLAIKGSLKPGDHAVATMLEHNSVLRPLSELSRRGIISLTLVNPDESGAVSPESIVRALRGNTKLVCVTHASNVTGAVQPVAAIGQELRRRGVRYLIDGAQALGALPVDVGKLECDLYAFPGHKGLLGPQGTGGLWIAPDTELDAVRQGGTGTDSDNMLQPEGLPEKYEAGTLNYHGIAGLGAGAEYVRARLSQIMMAERELSGAIYEALSDIPDVALYSPSEEAGRSGIVSFNVGDYSSSDVADALARRDIAVRGGLHCAPGAHRVLGTLERGAVRASVGHATGPEDAEALIAAVYDIARSGIN